MTKKIAILGSTGSIGTQTLDVVRSFPGEFDVVALSAHSSVEQLKQQVSEFDVPVVGVTAHRVEKNNSDWIYGPQALEEIAALDLDILVLSVVGAAGLAPCITALEKGTTVALANKEVLVIGGELISKLIAGGPGCLIPVDSEHSALFQLLNGEKIDEVEKVIITASGGPFREFSRSQLEKVTPEQALDHPNWEMGAKVTIDSATMMNKGLEVIEACYLFGLQPEQVDALVHPQSTVHGFVQFRDNSLLAQCAAPDMRLPIQYALFYPARRLAVVEEVDLTRPFSWDFEPVDAERFPAFALAARALEQGRTYPAVLNAANEVAVEAFLNKKIGFMQIPALVEAALEAHQPLEPGRDNLLRADKTARDFVKKYIESAPQSSSSPGGSGASA
ncbi:MAG: 1-deoxy-D-xylulose-5-phosphate reductoisomerase [bacterium]